MEWCRQQRGVSRPEPQRNERRAPSLSSPLHLPLIQMRERLNSKPTTSVHLQLPALEGLVHIVLRGVMSVSDFLKSGVMWSNRLFLAYKR